MFCIYLIQHHVTKELHIGKTSDLQRRVHEHNTGQQTATRRKSGSWILAYAESYRSKQDADQRERALKQHGSNKRWLLDRVKHSLLDG